MVFGYHVNSGLLSYLKRLLKVYRDPRFHYYYPVNPHYQMSLLISRGKIFHRNQKASPSLKGETETIPSGNYKAFLN